MQANCSGGMSELEMTSIANDAVLTLEESKVTVKRIMVGSVMVCDGNALPNQ